MKCICMSILTSSLIFLTGCSDNGAYNAALQSDAKLRDAAWAKSKQIQEEDAKLREAAWAKSKQIQEEEITKREAAWAESERIQKKAKELQDRYEVILKKQEEQSRRFDAILDKWDATPTKENN